MTPNDIVVLQSLAKQFDLFGKVFDNPIALSKLNKQALWGSIFANMCHYHAQMLRDIAQRNNKG